MDGRYARRLCNVHFLTGRDRGVILDLRKIKKLIELVEASGIQELEVHKGDESVRIVRPSGEPAPASVAVAAGEAAATGAYTIARAPMAGTFYAAPEPGTERFVAPGAPIGVGETLCIIESMKMMNEIPSEVDGVVVKVLVGDGEPVARGQGLFRING